MSYPFKNDFRKFCVRCISLSFPVCSALLLFSLTTHAQRQHAPGNGQRAVVIDERLAVLREAPSLSARLLKRLGRGRSVSLLSVKRSREGVIFYRVAVTRRTRGWLQREAVITRGRKGDDERLLDLIRASNDFDRVARACIFLVTFTRSPFRPAVLLILGVAVEDAARKLSIDAAKRLDEAEMLANRASTFSYFMNYNGLDRYRRLGIDFVFDEAKKRYHYDGATWREILRRFPRSAEAIEAQRRLDSIGLLNK